MRNNSRLLIIGPPPLAEAVQRALPRCSSVATELPLEGVWQAGQQPFDGVIFWLGAARNALRAIRSLRQVAPHARIVVACRPSEEPDAREALQAGADEYVIEPLSLDDLDRALGIPDVRPRLIPVDAEVPALLEKREFADILRDVADGTQATLDRLAELLRDTFGATHAAIRVDDLTALAGTAGEPVLQEPIRRGGESVGVVLLGRSRHGVYAASAAARLGDYTALIEAVLRVARERAELLELVWSDDLTGLRNRRFFEKSLDELLERAVAERLRVTLVLFDIDDFKTYNDRYGHETGDALLREVATLLRRCSRAADVVVRFGGDEFAVILWDAERPRVPGSQHPTDPMMLAQRFRRAIAEHDFKCLGPGAPGPVTISGGLACCPWNGTAREPLLRAADSALLAAKRSGKNHIVLAGEAPQAPPPNAGA